VSDVMDWIVPAGFQKLKMYSLFLHCVCLCLSCIVIALLSCVSDFIQFFIRAVFSAAFSLTVLSQCGLLFLLMDVFSCIVHGK